MIRNRILKAYAPQIEKVIRDYFSATAYAVEQKGIHHAQGIVHSDHVLPGLTTVIQNLYRDAVKMATKKPVVNTKAFPHWLQIVFGFLDRFLLNKVVLPISQTTIDQVDEMLKEALDKGWGTTQMVDALKNTELPAWRARLISRTETVRATNIAQMVQATQSPFETEKMWIAVEDNRTRFTHTHAGVDGERVGLYEKYSNGGYFPGDPNLPAKEVCNCRCTQGFFAKRDLDGNLVPRDPQTAELELAKLLN